MPRLPDENLPAELQDVAARLRSERAEVGPVELDRIKLMAMNRARSEARLRRRSIVLRSGFASPMLALALLVAGLAAIAGTTTGTPISLGGSQASSSEVEYCEPDDDDDNDKKKADEAQKKADEANKKAADARAKANAARAKAEEAKKKVAAAKTAAEKKKAEDEAKKAEADAKKAEDAAKKAEAEKKKAEDEAKKAKKKADDDCD